jgi:hypothetical protein
MLMPAARRRKATSLIFIVMVFLLKPVFVRTGPYAMVKVVVTKSESTGSAR